MEGGDPEIASLHTARLGASLRPPPTGALGEATSVPRGSHPHLHPVMTPVLPLRQDAAFPELSTFTCGCQAFPHRPARRVSFSSRVPVSLSLMHPPPCSLRTNPPAWIALPAGSCLHVLAPMPLFRTSRPGSSQRSVHPPAQA